MYFVRLYYRLRYKAINLLTGQVHAMMSKIFNNSKTINMTQNKFPTKFSIITPADFHVHLRQTDMMFTSTLMAAKHYGTVLVMPNTNPPITDGQLAKTYKTSIISCLPPHLHDGHFENSNFFNPLMTIKIGNQTPLQIVEAKEAGVVAGKLYVGVTTNEPIGLNIVDTLFPLFKEMEDSGMILCIHGELKHKGDTKINVFEREKEFLPMLENIISNFPNLKIVMEHITTKEAVDFLLQTGPNIAATITVHHLLDTIDAVLAYETPKGEYLNPHNYCKPVLKFDDDRDALQQVVLSGNPKFFFGSDSAPHKKENKECECGCAGVFSGPGALPLLVDFFNTNNQTPADLEKFVSISGRKFYGIDIPSDVIDIYQEQWEVPKLHFDVVPYRAGTVLDWMITSRY